jgi:hypothetical protein
VSWDAGWYRSIASHGYSALDPEALRFFPAWPELVRVVHMVGAPVTWTLVLGSSFVWWAALVALDQLGATLGFEGRIRTTACWLISLAPGALASVLGYADPLLVFLVAAALAMIYSGRGSGSLSGGKWLGVAVLGVCAALTRPVGIFLAIPIAIEVWRQRSKGPAVLWQALAVLGPVFGLSGYLLWVQHQFGNAWLPVRIQTEAGHHGALTDPISGVVHAASLVTQGHMSALVHLGWVALAIAALFAGVRRLPLSASVYSAAIIGVALCGANLDSFERYLLASPALFLAAGAALKGPWPRRVVLGVLATSLVVVAFLSFCNYFVP